MKANLTEIMESIQGEGTLVGSRQIFVRFSGCNLRCSYCDTTDSFESVDQCRLNRTSGRSDQCEYLTNPLSVSEIQAIISQFSSKWVSLTGGEPLLWADFISELGEKLKSAGYKLMLETNGILYKQLELCLPYIDLVSMDYKLPSATGEDNLTNHTEFLIRAARKPVFVKVVIDDRVNDKEMMDAITMIAAVNNNIPLILQPVTPTANISAPHIDRVLRLQEITLGFLTDVRILPQLHKLMHVI